VPPSEIPLVQGGCLSQIFYSYVKKVIRAGEQRPFDFDMLYKVDDKFLYADYQNFEPYFDDNKDKYEDDFLELLKRYARFEIWIFDLMTFFK
jgi:hypothetical protein